MQDFERALQLLRLACNDSKATFRPGQWEAIAHIVENRGRLLLVQRTGWGKSFVYFIATRLLRERGQGPAMLVSPLLALMRNQLNAAHRMGVKAETIHSENKELWNEINAKIQRGEVDVLLISPERFANEWFKTVVLPGIVNQISLFIIDEAHCISDWGHDFRPHYRLIRSMLSFFPKNLRLLATTATANQRVVDDLMNVLGSDGTLHLSRGPLQRNNLFLQNIPFHSDAEKMAWLAQFLQILPGSGIIYTSTVHDSERLASWLRANKYNVQDYHSKKKDNRHELEKDLLENKLKALVATNALGMGFDKPDLAFVIHYHPPGSLVSYYQQIGRAGRAIEYARCILLYASDDWNVIEYFIRSAFPEREDVINILQALDDSPNGMSINELQGVLNISRSKLEKSLELMELEDPPSVVKRGSKFLRTPVPSADALFERAQRITKLRYEEMRLMQAYCCFNENLMYYVVSALDGDTSQISTPTLEPLPQTPDPALIQEAQAFLKKMHLPIEPRKQWPYQGFQIFPLSGKIPEAHRHEVGRALCIWNEGDWGKMVKDGKYRHGHFDDELVNAVVELLRRWSPRPEPVWVTCIPSLRHPTLVPDFAKRVANVLGIPFIPCLKKTQVRSPQKKMENIVQQARNLDGSLELDCLPLPGPVLLIDDVIDSGLTFAVASWLLRSNGSGQVFPLALALAKYD